MTDSLAVKLAEFRPPRVDVVREPRVVAVARRVRETWHDAPTDRLSDFRLQELYKGVATEWARSSDLRQVAPRSRRWLPWILFYPPDARKRWLGRDDHLREQYVDWLKSRSQPGRVLALLRAFLLSYPADLPTFSSWRESILALVRHSDSVRLADWRDRCRQYGLLRADGPVQFGRQLLKADNSERLFEEAGLTGELRSSAFVREALRHAMVGVAKGLVQEPDQTRSVERLEAALIIEDRVAFPELRSELASCLLGPFSDATPSAAVESVIRRLLFKALGDPRIFPAAGWNGVDRALQEILLRWLVRGTIDDFLSLIRATADASHWRFRERFWRAYLDAGYISDAWIVLGRSAEWQGKFARASRRGEYAVLNGASSAQSVLLLRIGHLVIAEWSHAGACRVWSRGSRRTPALYGRSYSALELRAPADFELRHTGSSSGLWQQRLARFIRDRTNIRYPGSLT